MTRRAVLFVCLGNICRSPTGEGVLRALVESRGLADRIDIDSAGTGSWHVGESSDPRMREAAERRGYRLDSIARQVAEDDFERFDLLVAMDRSNLDDLHAKAPAGTDLARIRLLSEFLDGDWPQEVPDPYYGGAEGFDYVLDMIESAGPRLIDHLLEDDEP